MKIKDVMTASPLTCHTRDTLDASCRIMWDSDCGSVPVVDDEGRLAGILTDRDVAIASWTRGEPMSRIPAAAVMSTKVTTCHEDDNVGDVHDKMRAARVRRIPVVDADGRPRGIVSLNDIACHAGGNRGRAHSQALEEVGKTLAHICAHRSTSPVRAVA